MLEVFDLSQYPSLSSYMMDTSSQRKKKQLLAPDQVTDEQGRRRFHGAFTGGFSAGHFNTVGSAEGWTPKSFVSSR